MKEEGVRARRKGGQGVRGKVARLRMGARRVRMGARMVLGARRARMVLGARRVWMVPRRAWMRRQAAKERKNLQRTVLAVARPRKHQGECGPGKYVMAKKFPFYSRKRKNRRED